MKSFVLYTIIVLTAVGEPIRSDDDTESALVKGATDYILRKLPMLNTEPLPTGRAWSARLSEIFSLIRSNMTTNLWETQSRRTVESVKNRPKFSCTLNRSSAPPSSVHALQPGDVNVIGAIGDSLTSANGAKAWTIFGLIVQYRGVAMSVGGGTSLQYDTTLPNILRMGNKKLRGHSTGTGGITSRHAQFNLAEPGSKAEDMPGQAAALVAKMRKSQKINFVNDWKIVTVMVGGNDICDFCKDKGRFSIQKAKAYLMETLDILQQNLPRTFVNLVDVLDVTLVKDLKKHNLICRLLQSIYLCKCAANVKTPTEIKEVSNYRDSFSKMQRDLIASGRYDTKDDFTVVLQPFMKNSKPPLRFGKYDQSYFAPDCFHFSGKGHSESAKSLWNNMLQPVGKKSESWNSSGGFNCPTEKRPYFATAKN